MNDILETLETEHFIGELYYDHGCYNPREDDDAKSLFLGLPHRRYNIGDETIDPSTFTVDCPDCEGTGQNPNIGDTLCERCEGEGYLQAGNMAELEELIQLHYKPVILRKVGMYEHGGRAFYLGGGPASGDSAGWDSGTCGFIMLTREILVMRGGEEWADSKTEAELEEWLKGDVQEYEDWAEGRCFRFEIYERCANADCCPSCDGKGELVDSCGGFIGDYAEVALKEELDGHEKFYLTNSVEHGKVSA